MKRYRSRKQKPGLLQVYYGMADGDGPDVCYNWGEGCHKADSHLLHHVLNSERMQLDLSASCRYSFAPSLVDELKSRGYDITTLKFSIRKLETEKT
jgi:hypothetical protein